MPFHEHQVKGLSRLFADTGLAEGRLRMHISELAPGLRSHPPHQHEGVEGFYVIEGEGTLEIADERQVIRANEGIVFDPTKLHGLLNSGEGPMRYIVIIAREP